MSRRIYGLRSVGASVAQTYAFAWIGDLFPESVPILDQIARGMSGGSLEAQLAHLVKEAHASEHIRRQLMAFRFYC
jgi:hypothetical protein